MSGRSELVLFVVPTYDGGGAERIVLTVAAALHARGRPVLVVGLLESGSVAGGLVPSIGLGASRVGSSRRLLRALIRSRRPAVVVSTLKHVSIMVATVQLACGLGFRHVIRVANTYSRELHGKRLLDRIAWSLGLRLSHRFAAATVAVSAGVAQDLQQHFGVAVGRCVVVPNPVDFPRIDRLAKEAPPAWLAAIRGRRLIIAVGRLTRQKDFATLIEAFGLARQRGIPDACLAIIGEGPERAALAAQAERLGIGTAVLLPGWEENPYRILAAADLFVLSSRHEGLPNALLEALAVGLPTVATDCESGPREILVRPDLGQLVPVGDADAMANAMVTAMTAGRSALRREHVAARYDFDALLRQYERVIFDE